MKELSKRKKEAKETTKGQMITEERNIVFSNELTRIEREDLTKDNDEGV